VGGLCKRWKERRGGGAQRPDISGDAACSEGNAGNAALAIALCTPWVILDSTKALIMAASCGASFDSACCNTMLVGLEAWPWGASQPSCEKKSSAAALASHTSRADINDLMDPRKIGELCCPISCPCAELVAEGTKGIACGFQRIEDSF